MTTTTSSNPSIEENNPPAPAPRGSLGDRLLDRLTASTYLLPLILIAGVMWYFGLRRVFFLALIGGCIVWWYWGRRMSARDGKLILAVDIESAIVAPMMIGRRRWQKATKIGRPFLQFSSPSGYDIEIVKSYDGTTNTVTYPPIGEYSDLHIASIPARYGELIDELVTLSKENLTATMETELNGVRKAREHNTRLSSLIDDLMVPGGGK